MSKWNSPEWEALYSGVACPVCRQGKPTGVIAELRVTYLTSGPDSTMKGNCTLILKRHAVEVYELDPQEACELMYDLQRISKAIQEVTGAIKMNYEIHGNTLPHLHIHLFPRYRGDPFENGPINPKLIQESPYEEGEYEHFVQQLQAKLGMT